MATNDITTAFVKQFGSNLDFLVQQKGSILRNAVRTETVVGEEAYFDQLAATAAIKKTTRNSDTPLIKSEHKRRRVTMYDYEWADLIDKEDKLKMLIDPQSDYATNAAWALGRSIDDAIIEAFSGTAYAGKAGGTATHFTAANIVSCGATGLSLQKLLDAKEKLDAAEVDPNEERIVVITAAQLADLLNVTEIKDADYNTVRALVRGEVNTFLGCRFIVCNRLASINNGTVVGNGRSCFMYARSGILLALAKDINTQITQRADKSYATQVYACMGIGAVRMEEEKCIQILCTE
jgi:hypothetical protein